MKPKYYIQMLLCGALCTSCNDFLDVKPVGKLIPTEVSQFENLLNNESTIDFHMMDNNGGCGAAYWGDNLSVSENQAKYLYTNTHVNLNRYAAYIYYEPCENPLKTSHNWEWGIYRATGLFNNVIEGIEGLGVAKEKYAAQVIAQAKAGRAWSYLVGTLAYGPAYDPNGTNDALTIPYRTAASPQAVNPMLATTAEAFNLLKTDLDYAVTHAPEHVANPSRANLSAAYALRAIYWMHMRNWNEMFKDADAAWTQALAVKGGSVDKLIYNFNEFYYEADETASPRPGENVEIYLQLKSRDGDTDFDKSYSRENLFYRIAPPGSAVYPSEDYLALFDSQTDLRYKLFLLNQEGYSSTSGGVVYQDGIQRYNMRGRKTINNEGITYPELLLMRAEAQARLNHLTEALNDLNLLRKYRYSGSDTDLPNGASMNQDQLLEEILKERRRELPMESFQRIFDLKRYLLDAGKPWCKTTITHKIGGKTYSTTVIPEKFCMKIPNSYINFNPQWGLTPWEGTYDPKSAE